MANWIALGMAVIAVASLFVSISALRRSGRTARDQTDIQREQIRLQERVTEIEETRERNRLLDQSRAKPRPRVERDLHNRHWLVIENTGETEARNISVWLDGKPFGEHRLGAMEADKGRIPVLGPTNAVKGNLFVSFGTEPTVEVLLSWDDESAEGRKHRTTLSLF